MSSVSSEYIGYRLEVFIAVFIPIQLIAVALRFYARSLTVQKYDGGDWLISAALIGQLVAAGIAISSVRNAGVGHHAAYLAETNPEALTSFFKYLVAMSTWYATTEGLAKFAICILYKRIFVQKHMHLMINMTMCVLAGASIGGGLADLFGCTPFSAHWGTAEEQAEKCINTEALFVWGSFPNIVTDVVLMVLPMPTVWNLHASTGMRIGLIISFLFGSIGTITSILRFIAFYNKSSFVDPTYNGVELIIWTVCEPGVYLIAACLLVYRPLLDKLGIKMLVGIGSRGKSSGVSGQKIAGAQGHASRKNQGLRTIGGGELLQYDDNDERPLRTHAGITARTDIEMVREPRSARCR